MPHTGSRQSGSCGTSGGYEGVRKPLHSAPVRRHHHGPTELPGMVTDDLPLFLYRPKAVSKQGLQTAHVPVPKPIELQTAFQADGLSRRPLLEQDSNLQPQD
ncbi:hypothetical protein [Parasphingorhabdus litoris]|uniref:hypothetical protein n=1 Tax=Parasphingorhabdus litoris TaxID=394733 RepID=UPI001E406CAB|nr:hypothetical protein [Parasphingorhabdus litoris]